MTAIQRDADGHTWPIGTSRNTTRKDVKSCTWEGIIPFSNTGWVWMGWEKDLERFWWEVAISQQHACPGSKESQQHPGLSEQEKSQETEVMFSLYLVLVRSHLNITSRFGLLIAWKTLISWMDFSRRPARWTVAQSSRFSNVQEKIKT